MTKRQLNMLCKILVLVVLVIACIFPGGSFADVVKGGIQTDIVKNIEIKSTYGGTTTIENLIFSPLFFENDSSQYNHELAQFSMALSAASYGSSPKYIERAFTSFGFRNDTIYDKGSYTMNYSKGNDVVGFSFADKEIDIKGKPWKLVVVAIRETNRDEWYSNFNINDSGENTNVHEGFSKAEQQVMGYLSQYLSKLEYDYGNTKILITGHSRGAAVANLLVGDLVTNYNYADKENIYGYTFATPNTVVNRNINYNNIFNIVNPSDFIAYLPLSQWGYYKYGTNYALPCEKDTDYEKLKKSMQVEFGKYVVERKFIDLPVLETREFINQLYINIPKAENVYNIKYVYGQNAKGEYLYVTPKEYFKALAGIMSGGETGVGDLLLYSNSNLGNSTKFFIRNLVLSRGITDSHSPEAYMSWLKVTNAQILQGDYYSMH